MAAWHDLVLSAKRSTWRMHDHAGEADQQFQQQRGAVLQRADRRCWYCELRAEKWQEVHHVDDDHANQADSNLVCACPLCHQVFHLGLAGLHDGGEIILAPEFSQVELNALTLGIWLAVAGGGECGKAAKTVYDELRSRNHLVTTVFREWAREAKVKLQEPFRFTPDMLANALMSIPDEQYDNRAQLMGGLRLLPKDTRFADQLHHWIAHYRQALPSSQWHKIVRDFSGLVASVERTA